MTAIKTAIAAAALALALPAGPLAAQNAPGAPLVVVQSSEDSAEAEQADRDREEAERIDRRRRRLEREEREADEAPLAPERDEQAEWRREEYRDWSACIAKLPAEQAAMVERIREGSALSIQSIRDSANGGNVAAAVQEQQRLRDEMIKAVLGSSCG